MNHLSVEQFGSDVQTTDNLYGLLFDVAPTKHTLNLENAGFVKPMGAMAIVLATRCIAKNLVIQFT